MHDNSKWPKYEPVPPAPPAEAGTQPPSVWRFERDPWMTHLDQPMRSVSGDAVIALRAWTTRDTRRRFSVDAGYGSASFLEATLFVVPSDARAMQDLGALMVRYGLSRRRLRG